MRDALTRRDFVALVAFAPFASFAPRAVHDACPADRTRRRPAGPHPTPRPGITAERVPADGELSHSSPAVLDAFRAVREIPHIVDGIRCHCGCADFEGYYSLLSCYEGAAMAQHCEICQGQARMARRLHEDGRSLDEIRAATDARYG